MPTIQNILRLGGAGIDPAPRAEDAWNRIQDKPTTITVVRKGVAPFTQTVRLEFDNTIREDIEGASGKSSERPLTVFGIRDHPTEADTDLKRDDRFSVNGTQYKVMDVQFTLGELQARAEASS